MSIEQYRRLRRFVADQEEKTGKRITHQAFIEGGGRRTAGEAGRVRMRWCTCLLP